MQSDAAPVRIELRERIVIVRPLVALTADSIVEILAWLYERPEFQQRRDLWDMRGLEARMDYEAMRRVTKFTRKHRDPAWPQDRSAIVVEGDLMFGFARMYEAMSQERSFTVRVLTDFDEAVAWLDPPASEA